MKRRVALVWSWLWALVALLLSAAHAEAAQRGAALYETHCARCHNGTTPRAPPKSLLAIMASGAVLRALESGVMARYAEALSGAERRALVTHLTGRAPAPPGRSLAAPADPDYACCTFQGGVAAYAAGSGRQLWKGRTIDKPPSLVGRNAAGTDRLAPSGAPVWNTPSIDAERGLLYVGTGENYSSPANAFSDAIVALRLDTGAIAWHRQMTAGDAWNMGCETAARINCPPEDGPDFDFGAATIIARDGEGRDVLLAGQKSGQVYALDLSRRGALRWRRKLGRGGIQGGVHFGMAVHGQTLYVPMSDFDGGPRWPGIARPGMFAVDITSGKTLWYTAHADHCRGRAFCQPGISAAATSIPGAVLGGAMDGVLRAYAADTGEVLWSFDTAREFAATDGGVARGGSMGGASGAVPSGDMLFVNSGYGIYFHMPGAALLAFGPKN